MSIFEAMEGLAGAALLTLAPALQVGVPPQQRSRGVDLVQLMRSRGVGDVIDGYVGELTREIWVGAETRSLPQEELELHFKSLAEIIAQHAVEDECLEGIFTPDAGNDRARRIAIDLFLKTRDGNALATQKLSEDVALFVLERSFARLLREPQRLTALAPLLTEFASRTPAATSAIAGGGASTVAAARAAARAGILRIFERQISGDHTFFGDHR